ncbi:hypothetical protein E2C01_053744 [Portunus trituberculatus]|uniref:Uncharacterized protein n=1 Tax=Portunus trituberculatus TaxID=210409 RepID=A0A5B7GRB1_PORTR|nr:hypothetical protein [Portunus trituberculatus]
MLVFLGRSTQIALLKRQQVALHPLPLSRFEISSSVFVWRLLQFGRGDCKQVSPPRKFRSPLLDIRPYLRPPYKDCIGYTYLTQRYLLTRDPQPYCNDRLVPLTMWHPLVECPGPRTSVSGPWP